MQAKLVNSFQVNSVQLIAFVLDQTKEKPCGLIKLILEKSLLADQKDDFERNSKEFLFFGWTGQGEVQL